MLVARSLAPALVPARSLAGFQSIAFVRSVVFDFVFAVVFGLGAETDFALAFGLNLNVFAFDFATAFDFDGDSLVSSRRARSAVP